MLSAHEAFGDGAELVVVDRPYGLATLALYELENGAVALAGMEPTWGFACPLVGPNPEVLAAETAECASMLPWDHLLLPGFPDDLHLARRVAPAFGRFGSVMGGPGIGRQVANITDLDRWWLRRSSRFRRNLRRARITAQAAGLRFVDLSDEPTSSGARALIDRLVGIELRTWKGQGSINDEEFLPTGIAAPDMQNFYRRMTDRLVARGRARVVIATLDGVDVGYILGGIRNGRYRGLQLSFTTEVRALSVGHLLQLHEIQHLAETGLAHTYDLGMDMDYKRAWADGVEQSITLIVNRES